MQMFDLYKFTYLQITTATLNCHLSRTAWAWMVVGTQQWYPHTISVILRTLSSSVNSGKYGRYSSPSVGHWAFRCIDHQVCYARPCDARPMVTFPGAEHRPLSGTILYCLVTEEHACEQLSQSCYLTATGRPHNRLMETPTPKPFLHQAIPKRGKWLLKWLYVYD